MTDAIPSCAVAYLRGVEFGDDIIRYMREIDGTFGPSAVNSWSTEAIWTSSKANGTGRW